jgi:hypothetical protein
MDRAVIDHRGPIFAALGLRALSSIRTIFKTASRVFIYPASGTGAWEAALTNTLSPGDTVLMYETGHFAFLWKQMALKLGLKPDFIESGGVVGDTVGGMLSDSINRRTGNIRLARLSIIVLGSSARFCRCCRYCSRAMSRWPRCACRRASSLLNSLSDPSGPSPWTSRRNMPERRQA